MWWNSHRESFPNLYRLVRDVLCIPGKFLLSQPTILLTSPPGSEVAVERVLSGGRDLIGIRRASLLHADTIRNLMLAKAQLWLHHKAVIDLNRDEIWYST